MSRARLVLAIVAAASLAGCEGLLGVDDLTFGTGDAGNDASVDGSGDAPSEGSPTEASDAPVDAPVDAGPGDASHADAADAAPDVHDDAAADGADGSDGACVVTRSMSVLNDAIAVAGGLKHMCALRADGSVVCWGDNSLGQLGVPQGTTLGTSKPIVVQFPVSAPAMRRIVSGFNTMYAIDANLQLWAWGANDVGELGNGTQDATAHPTPALVNYSGGGPMVVRALTVSWSSTCAIDTTGSLYCWGSPGQGGTTEGLLGPMLQASTWVETDAGSLVPYQSPTIGTLSTPGAAPLLGGGNGSAAICYATDDANQHVYCFGADVVGELLQPGGGGIYNGGYNINAGGPLASAGATFPLADMQFGTLFGCAIDSAGALLCWGSDPALDGGWTASPNRTTGDAGFSALGVAYVTVCVVSRPDGRVLCRGSDGYGDLGLGGATTVNVEVTTFGAVVGADGGPLLGVGALTRDAFQSLCAIEQGSCGPDAGGTVVCWGNNDNGQIGSDAGFEYAGDWISTRALPVTAP